MCMHSKARSTCGCSVASTLSILASPARGKMQPTVLLSVGYSCIKVRARDMIHEATELGDKKVWSSEQRRHACKQILQLMLCND